MTEKKVITVTDHPLEDFFGIESNSTEVVKIEQKTDAIKIEDFDDKDDENERLLLDIHDLAISEYKNQIEAVEDSDLKYASRGREVANQLLQTALQSIKEKVELKKHKDKINKTDKSNKTATTTVIMDTNALIAELRKSKAIDGSSIDITPIETPDNNNKE